MDQAVKSKHNPLVKFVAAMAALSVLLFLTIVLATLLGSEKLPALETLCAALTASSCGLDQQQTAILFDIRLPRVLLAVAVGAALAVAGGSYQSLLRNPLAEP